MQCDGQSGVGEAEWRILRSYEKHVKDFARWFYRMRILSLALWLIFALVSSPSSADQITLEQEHGIYMVPVRINQAVTIPFILDSGASEVAIPADVFTTLMRSHSVRDNDFIGDAIFVTADGTKHKSQRFILREVKVGSQVINDVVANVVPIEGDPLLGQSFLSRLPSWSIDNNAHVLNLANGEANEANSESQPTSGSPVPPPPASLPTSGDVSTSLRYKTTNCGSIVDSRTGLEWFVGPDADKSWMAAQSWARNVVACGKQWALPTIGDLRSIFEKQFVAGTGYFTSGRYWPAHIEPVFSAIGQGSWVWAQGEPTGGNAPAFNFNQGLAVSVSASHFHGTIRAFAVVR
jgi:clan AA aspartic protease (TIGR02281 family)